MKTVFSTTCLALTMGFALPSLAASDHSGHTTAKAATAAKVQLSDGVVKKVDKTAGKVTVAHGPLHNLNMSSMTMVFRVKDASWLEQLKDGDKIRFLADKVDKAYTIVQLER